jgi:hypothetical protein
MATFLTICGFLWVFFTVLTWLVRWEDDSDDDFDPDRARRMAETDAAIAKSRANIARIQAEMDARYGTK